MNFGRQKHCFKEKNNNGHEKSKTIKKRKRFQPRKKVKKKVEEKTITVKTRKRPIRKSRK